MIDKMVEDVQRTLVQEVQIAGGAVEDGPFPFAVPLTRTECATVECLPASERRCHRALPAGSLAGDSLLAKAGG